MTKFAKRLSEAMTIAGYDDVKLAKKLNISRQAVYKWTSGATTPGFETLISIAEILNTSLDYLMRGITFSSVPDTFGNSRLLSITAMPVYTSAFRDANSELKLTNPVDTYLLPGMNADDYFIFQLTRDNMECPDIRRSIFKGDYMLVDRASTPSHGDIIFALENDNRVSFYQLFYEEHLFNFVSFNPLIPPFKSDYSEISFMHPVKQVIHKPRTLF